MTFEEENLKLRTQIIQLTQKIINPPVILSNGDRKIIEKEVKDRISKQFKHICFNFYWKDTS